MLQLSDRGYDLLKITQSQELGQAESCCQGGGGVLSLSPLDPTPNTLKSLHLHF